MERSNEDKSQILVFKYHSFTTEGGPLEEMTEFYLGKYEAVRRWLVGQGRAERLMDHVINKS